MSDTIGLTKVGPVVRLDMVGEYHVENGRAIVGDTDIMRRLQSSFGSHRQMAEVVIEVYLLTSSTIEVSPSGDGEFSEASEPASAPAVVVAPAKAA